MTISCSSLYEEFPVALGVEMMMQELEAGAWKVIAEARESGTVGVFQKSGATNIGLIDEITHSVPPEKIMWEAPQKAQQVWFIKKFGTNVNLSEFVVEPFDSGVELRNPIVFASVFG